MIRGLRNGSLPVILGTLVVTLSLPAVAGSPVERLDLSPQEWREDLAYFARELPAHHGSAFLYTPRERFQAAVAELDGQLERMKPDEVFVGLERLASMIGDGHTYVRFPRDSPEMPLRFRRFGGEYRIVVVAPGLERALGARLVAIGDAAVASVHDLMLPLTPQGENAPLQEASVTGYLTSGIVLHGLGVTSSRDSVLYTLADSLGQQFALEVHALPAGGAQPAWVWASRGEPLSRTKPEQGFWCTLVPGSRTVYCSFRRYADLHERAQELFSLLDRERPEKLVIDLRQNVGGDYTVGEREVIRPIAARADINRPGHLFVLVGPQTFSAGMNNAAQFRSQTKALLVGGTIGEKPNSWQEPREMTLPRSHLTVRYSTRYYEFVKTGENAVRPDHEVAPSWDDFRAGRDPALDWVLAYDPEHPPAAAPAR